jgi:hypothetical protein
VTINYFGAALFVIGEIGNFYHHWRLSTLRRDGKNGCVSGAEFFFSSFLSVENFDFPHVRNLFGMKYRYSMPSGAGFDHAVMPHYGLEVLTWIGWCIASGRVNPPAIAFLIAGFAAMYPRAKAKKEKYLEIFDGKDGRPKYDRNMKLMIPYII